jgi:hypothetical protein
MTKDKPTVTVQDRAEIERWVSEGFSSGRVDCDEGELMKYIWWELDINGNIKFIDVWYK